MLGINTGDVKSRLVKEYTKIGYQKGIDSNYNAHNQYLESMLAGGVILLSILLIMLGYYFFYAILNKSLLMSLFVCVIAINFLFESMFNTISGVGFITFFYVFFLNFQEKEFKNPSY